MANSPVSAPDSKAPWIEKAKFLIAIIGLLSTFLAGLTYFGLKPEKQKSLAWEYFSKNSLINPSAAPVDKLEIFYASNKMKQLTVVSARLFNNGALPIDSSDVKDNAFPTVTFSSIVRVIAAEIKSRSPTNIVAHIHFTPNSVRLEHGLLNPSDSLSIEILLDGDPGDITALPRVSCRIAGLHTPTTIFPSPPSQKTSPVYFRVSTPAQFFMLTAASIATLIVLLIFFFGTYEMYKEAFPSVIINKVTEQVVSAPAIGSTDPTKLPEVVASLFHQKLPSPLDARARAHFTTNPALPSESGSDYVRRAADQLKELPRLRNVRGLILGSLFLIFFAALAFASLCVTVAAWHQHFSGP